MAARSDTDVEVCCGTSTTCTCALSAGHHADHASSHRPLVAPRWCGAGWRCGVCVGVGGVGVSEVRLNDEKS